MRKYEDGRGTCPGNSVSHTKGGQHSTLVGQGTRGALGVATGKKKKCERECQIELGLVPPFLLDH